jgi:TM2 domain-containing membrane protein YozV
MNEKDLEKKFLEFVYTTDATITPGALAYYAGCTLKEAETLLDRYAREGTLKIESDDDGHIFYVYPNRAKLDPRRPTRPQPTALAVSPAVHVYHPAARYINPGTAGVLSFLWPGAGQIYTGHVGAGIGWMIGTGVGYVFLVIPGLILHFLCILSALKHAREENARTAAGLPPHM